MYGKRILSEEFTLKNNKNTNCRLDNLQWRKIVQTYNYSRF